MRWSSRNSTFTTCSSPRPSLRRVTRRALLVAAFDSQLKWVAGIRVELAAHDFHCYLVVPDLRPALSPGQIAAAAGIDEVEPVGWSELIGRALDSDVVVCGLSGPFTQRFTVDLAARA